MKVNVEIEIDDGEYIDFIKGLTNSQLILMDLRSYTTAKYAEKITEVVDVLGNICSKFASSVSKATDEQNEDVLGEDITETE